MIDTTYVIVPTEELTDTMISYSINESEYIRYSLDNSKAILKYSSKFPDVAKGYVKYSHKEILIELTKSEWLEE